MLRVVTETKRLIDESIKPGIHQREFEVSDEYIGAGDQYIDMDRTTVQYGLSTCKDKRHAKAMNELRSIGRYKRVVRELK